MLQFTVSAKLTVFTVSQVIALHNSCNLLNNAFKTVSYVFGYMLVCPKHPCLTTVAIYIMEVVAKLSKDKKKVYHY